MVKETNALGKFIQTNYDSLGRVTAKSDYYGRFTNYTYDKLGRLIKVETPFEGSYTSKTKYYYDNNGNKTKDLLQSNVPGQAETYDRTDYCYDNRNRLIKAVKYDTNGTANYTQYSYDAAGNKTKMFTGLTAEVNTTTETGTDTNFSVTRYAYNFMNQMTSMTDPLGMVTYYSSDITGNVISMTDRLNITTYYSYNVNNQLLNQSVVKDGVRQEIQYTYDILGNRNSMIDETGTYYYTYDDLGRLKSQTEPGVITKAYSYDAAGNRKSFTLTKNGGAEISIQYTYDKLNRLSTVVEGGQTTTYGYDDNGNRNTLSSTSGLASDYAYNNANKLTSLTNKKGASILSQFAYTYYINGNMSGKTETAGTTSYAYDGLGRLKNETQPGSVVYSYLYDDYHNRSTMIVTGGTDPGNTTYAYDKNNRLLTETKALATGATEVTQYQYDNNGNQIYKGKETFKNAVAGEIERFGAALAGESENNYTKDTSFYEYDGLNRLTKANAGGHAISYKYNGDGLRTSKNVDGALTYHVWDGSNMVMEMNGSGSATAKYIRGINLISAKDSAGTVQYYLFNGHGDVTSLTDSDGNVKKNYTYDAFGNEKNPDPNDTNVFRYTGEYFDKETGTIYLRARYYDPRMGRFVTEDSYWHSRDGIYSNDPLVLSYYSFDIASETTKYILKKQEVSRFNTFENGQEEQEAIENTELLSILSIIQSSNLYVYCINDPLRYTDSSGNNITENAKKGIEFMKEIFEQFPGFVKNTKSFITNFGNRIPDFKNNAVIGEIKNVAYQSLTKQIKGFIEIARESNKTFVLVISQGTKLSQPLIEAIRNAGGKIIEISGDASKTIAVPIITTKEMLDQFERQLEQSSDPII